jgi:hypothetical protein
MSEKDKVEKWMDNLDEYQLKTLILTLIKFHSGNAILVDALIDLDILLGEYDAGAGSS